MDGASQRKVPNLCFYWQGQYFQGFADFADQRKNDQILRKIAPTMRLERAAWKNFNFLVPGSDSASILICLACSRTFPGALFCIRMRLCGLPGRFRDVPGTSPKRSQSLAHGCLKPTLGRHALEAVESDAVRLPDGPKTAEFSPENFSGSSGT